MAMQITINGKMDFILTARVEPMTTNHQAVIERAQNGSNPKIGVVYWVQCKGYRTRAMIGRDGKWRALFNDRELPDVIGFSSD